MADERSPADIEKTINDVLKDMSVPGRYSQRTTENIRDVADRSIKTSTRDGAVFRATQKSGH